MMRCFQKYLVLLGLLWLMIGAFGCTSEPSPTEVQQIKRSFVEELTKQGTITTTQRAQILAALDHTSIQDQARSEHVVSQWWRQLNALHITFGIVLSILVISMLSLFGQFLRVRHFIFTAFAVALVMLIYALWGAPESLAAYSAFGGCLALSIGIGAIILKHEEPDLDSPWSWVALCVVWSISALHFSSTLNGAMAVATGFVALALIISVDRYLGRMLSLVMSNQSTIRIVALAFAILGASVHATLHVQSPWLVPFEVGALYLGSIVGYGGLLCLSSSCFSERYTFWIMQLVTPLLCFITLYVGEFEGLEFVRQCGGTTLGLFMLSKVMDVPRDDEIIFFGSLTLGAFLVLVLLFIIIQNPAFYGPYVFFI